MQIGERNQYGCPFYEQTGQSAVRDYAEIVGRLSPELRAALDAERAARQAELDTFRASQRARTMAAGATRA